MLHKRAMSTLRTKIQTPAVFAHLKPEPVVPSVAEAVAVLEGNDNTEKEAKFNFPRVLESGAFQFTRPTERKKYTFLMSSPRALADLALEEDDHYKRIVSGEEVFYDESKGIFPYAQAYAGFQFGQFAGQLGDGRVVNLFDVETPQGPVQLQLKGAGKTAFSRFADGKAVIRSSIREFVISEALNGVGIPTTRALSISVLPGTLAQRHYAEKCAVVSRFAPSWFRLGTFDLYRYRKDRQGLRDFCDYLINHKTLGELPEFVAGRYKSDKYASITEPADKDEHTSEKNDDEETTLIDITDSTRYDQLFRAIVRANARTVAYWQVYGFCNGVLNTDNTSIIGLSIDFGPFSFMDKFDPQYTPNDEDHLLRYSYQNQPSVVWWNLTRTGEALVELLGAGPELVDEEFFVKNGVKEEIGPDVISRAESIIKLASHEYKEVFMNKYNELFGKRLGLKSVLEGDNDFYAKLLDVLIKTQVDFNQFFVRLQESELDDHLVFMNKEIGSRYSNPQDKIDREMNEELEAKITEWLKLYKERLAKEDITTETRRSIAGKANPRFIPRNWMLEEVIREVEDSRGEEFELLKKITKMSSYPYDTSKWGDELKETEAKWLTNEADDEMYMKQCSCSS